MQPGTTLGHYTLVEQVGEGGMGQVWRATDTTLGRDVALKLIPAALAAEPDRILRFQREAKVLAALNHPNIAAIYGFHEEPGDGGPVRFLAMELVPGADLSERLAKGPLSRNEAVAAARQIGDALEYAHEQGIVHRDLKPANVKVTPEGTVKVLDFGLAKAVAPDVEPGHPTSTPTMLPTMTSGGTEKGIILGTAAYMSPEQARGQAIDRRTDIWAFGALLYELLTGRRAFEGDTVTDVLAAVITRDPDWDALPSDTPKRVRALLQRCMEKDPRRRLRDIGEARITLENLEDDAKSVSRAAPAVAGVAPKGSPLVRNAGWIAAALFAAALAFVTLKPSDTASTQTPLRKHAISLDEHSGTSDYWPSLSPDGRWLTYHLDNRIWLRDLTHLEARPIEESEGGTSSFWSPDGRWIGFFKDEGVWKVERAGGRPTLVAKLTAASGGSDSGVWTEDGRIVLGTGTAGLLEAPAQGGTMREILSPLEDETDFHELALLPGDRGILFVVHRRSGIDTIAMLLPDGTRRDVLRVDDTIGDPAYSPTGHILFRKAGDGEGIWAAPFSLDRLECTGDPFPVGPGGYDPTVSGDGTLVYADTPGRPPALITWYDRSGTKLRAFDTPVQTTRPFPDLSPDGTKIILPQTFGDGREIFLYDAASGAGRRVTFAGVRIDMAHWHPDGKSFVFYDNSGWGTYLVSGGTGDATRITDGIMPTFNSDGSELIMARIKPGAWDWDILRQSPPGDEASTDTVIAGSAVQWFGRISPDDRFITYTSDETGRDEIFVARYPSGEPRWQISTHGGSTPHWTRGGREIIYTTHDDAYAVSFNSSNGVDIGVPQHLFTRPNTNWAPNWPDGFAVTADGEQFIMLDPIQATDERPPMLVVVENWFREFDGESE